MDIQNFEVAKTLNSKITEAQREINRIKDKMNCKSGSNGMCNDTVQFYPLSVKDRDFICNYLLTVRTAELNKLEEEFKNL